MSENLASEKKTEGAPAASMHVLSHFEQVGGQEAVDRIVELFYQRMDSLPEAARIRQMHQPDLGHAKAVLKAYLAEWLGGPKRYSEERGHPRLRMRHQPFPIGHAERDAWLLCMQGALESVIASAPLRLSLLQQLAKIADWMRNQDGTV